MHLDAWTLLLQAVNFAVLAWLLHRLLYRPVLGMVARRRARVDELIATAEERERAVAQRETALAQQFAGIDAERQRMLGEARATIAAEHEQAHAALRRETEATAAREAARMAAERQAALDLLAGDAAQMAVSLAQALLADTGGAQATQMLLERACTELESLPSERRSALAASLATDRPLRICTAAALDEVGRAALAARLRDALGAIPAPVFEQDGALLAGVELHFPHALVSATWRDALATARARLVQR